MLLFQFANLLDLTQPRLFCLQGVDSTGSQDRISPVAGRLCWIRRPFHSHGNGLAGAVRWWYFQVKPCSHSFLVHFLLFYKVQYQRSRGSRPSGSHYLLYTKISQTKCHKQSDASFLAQFLMLFQLVCSVLLSELSLETIVWGILIAF